MLALVWCIFDDMRNVLLSFVSFSLLVVVQTESLGQSSAAKELLASTIDQLKSADGYKGDFTMKMFFDNNLETEEKGLIRTSGEKILMDLGQFKYVADGISSWTYLKERNEVQINDVSSDDFSMYNPLVLLDHFFQGGYKYEITNQFEESNITYSKLDIIPESRESEYAKIIVVISDQESLPSGISLIQKDGVRYDVVIDNIEINPPGNNSDFTFTTSDYPNIVVEDLRLGD